MHIEIKIKTNTLIKERSKSTSIINYSCEQTVDKIQPPINTFLLLFQSSYFVFFFVSPIFPRAVITPIATASVVVIDKVIILIEIIFYIRESISVARDEIVDLHREEVEVLEYLFPNTFSIIFNIIKNSR